MTTNSEKLENFTNELKNHPKLLEHFSHIVVMVKSETCRANDLNDFEEQVIDELRGFGKDIIEEWALKQSDSHAENMINSGFKLEYKGKKSLFSYHLREHSCHPEAFLPKKALKRRWHH